MRRAIREVWGSRVSAGLVWGVGALGCAALLVGCTSGAGPVTVVIHAQRQPDSGLAVALEDLEGDLQRLGARVSFEEPGSVCVPQEVHLEVLGHIGIDTETGFDAATLPSQTVHVVEERCGDGHRVVIAGGGRGAAQWAIYDFLEHLGIRYFHPEHTYYPDTWRWPDSPIHSVSGPSFMSRSMNVHRTHPVELSSPLEPSPGLDMRGYQRRWIDWTVKMRHTLTGGYDGAELGQYAIDRGFYRSSGLNLLNAQQGGKPLLNPDDPRPEAQIITEAIDAAMAEATPDGPIRWFGVSFNPNEFHEADDQLTVQRLTIISEYLTEHYPEVLQWATNHGTYGEPTPHYGVRFYDLGQFAPPEMGASVHLLMFYGLDRAAPVYGNTDFTHQRQWIEEQSQVRRVQYYPESSWWLTFDLPVPLFLAPATIEARARDVEILRPLLATREDDTTGVYAHRLFTSGQEWGYWLIDWCFSKLSWDATLTERDCYDDFTSVLTRGDAIASVLSEVSARQVDDMRDPELIRYLVGSDAETELALEAGIHFHPLPIHPKQVLEMGDLEAAALQEQSTLPLRAMALDYYRWAERIEALLGEQTPAQAPWVREIRDGLRIFALRADHAAEVYETALALRSALNASDMGAVTKAREGVDRARALTEQARQIVRAREADYRYPDELTILGDEVGQPGAVPNATTYPFRYLSRTHRMFYWTRPDNQLAELFGEGLEWVRVNARILPRSEPLEITLIDAEAENLEVDFGDGTTAAALASHAYEAMGEYQWNLSATSNSQVITHRDDVSVVESRYTFRKGSFVVVAPAAALILQAVLPGMVLGLGDDGKPFMAIGLLETPSQTVSTAGSVQRLGRSGLVSKPTNLELDVSGLGKITLFDAVLSLTVDDSPQLSIECSLRIHDVVTLLVDTGAFDIPGARSTVAALLDTTVEQLPESVNLHVRAEGTAGL